MLVAAAFGWGSAQQLAGGDETGDAGLEAGDELVAVVGVAAAHASGLRERCAGERAV